MRRYAKAASAGTTQRPAIGRGRIFRGALATRAASSSGSGSGAPSTRGSRSLRTIVAAVAACVATLLLVLAAPTSAATVTQRPLLFEFDGTNETHGPWKTAYSITVDNATGAVYTGESFGNFGEFRYLDRFHPDGTPWPFAASGSSSLFEQSDGDIFTAPLSLAVDNTAGANQSRLVAAQRNGAIEAYDFDGNRIWEFLARNGPLFVEPSDLAIDPAGHLWVTANGFVREYPNTGSSTQISSFSAPGGERLDFDTAGNLYLVKGGELQKWVGGAFSSTIDPRATNVYVDQSSPTGHIFTAFQGANEIQEVRVDATAGQFRLSFGGDQTTDLSLTATPMAVQQALEALPSVGIGNVSVSQLGAASEHRYRVTFEKLLGETDLEALGCGDGTTPLSGGTGCTVTTTKNGEPSDFQEYAANGTLIATYAQGMVGQSTSLAYYPSLNRVYVLQAGSNPVAAAFGPELTGTAPEVSIEPPSAVGVSTAHFTGTVDPEGTNSEWFFQWRKPGQTWAAAESSPAQSLPVDSNPHTVEYTTNTLRGNSTYQVRLVAVNTANKLRSATGGEVFTTPIASQTPAVTIDNASAITGTSAKITGTINPRSDTADWLVEVSTDPACATGFTEEPLQAIEEGSSSPVGVEYELTGLLPSEHYCARMKATNSAGSTTSSTKEFETLEVLPSQAFTAYAAPRTDTTARLNGYVNPEGTEATYRFEYSADGVNWTSVPDQKTTPLRRQIIVGAEIAGLEPSTTYRYRFLAESDAGLVEGDEETFETRSSAEMQLPTRGIELVNSPEKGTQNLARLYSSANTGKLVSADGERVVWNVFAGAPGGNSGAQAHFLAKRTSGGWVSQAMIPPAEQQVGGGSYTYKLVESTPDFRHFVMRAAQSEAIGTEPPTFVRLDDEQHEEALHTLTTTIVGNNDVAYEALEVSDDGAHVLFASFESEQIEDIGDGTPEVVSIMPDGTPSECGAPWGAFAGGTGPSGFQWRSGYHRMAATDASRLYFQTVPNGQSCEKGPQAIFYRDRNAEQTVMVDPGMVTTGSKVTVSAMIRATPDGRSLYFITRVSHVAGDANDAADIYRWDADTDDYSCLTCVVPDPGLLGTTGDPAIAAAVRVSDDFSHVYFLSENVLVPGYGAQGGQNLYVLSDGEMRFVADLGPATETITFALSHGAMSTDGNVLVWYEPTGGYAELTSDPLASQCGTNTQEEPTQCEELFRYEDSTRSLECVSCVHGGVTAQSAGAREPFPMLSADGTTLAFSTREALLPEDVNNTFDIYEWRNGALGLITDGETQFPSSGIFTTPEAYGIDATGENIFFSLIAPGLTGYEQDEFTNLYDARIGGGFPRPQEPAHCSEESCQGPLQAPPSQPSPGSTAGQAGSGNVPATRKRRCAGKRGKARRRCLRGQKRHKRSKGERQRAGQRYAGGAK